MARYQVTLAYDGTHFLGFQRQGKARTVQVVVETALRQLGWQGKTLLAAGRTDTGVHASGQTIAFDLDWTHDLAALGRAMNANLPEDVAVQSVAVTADDFHPRFDAQSRTYQYRVYCEPNRSPLRDRYTWRVWPAAEIEKLQAAASLFEGTHDFAAFGTPPRVKGSTIRTVYRANWEQQVDGLQFEITANAFLYHMVRRIVFLQVLTGQGRLDLEELKLGIVAARPQTPGLAPPQGLVLTKVNYAASEQELNGFRIIASGEDDRGKDLRH